MADNSDDQTTKLPPLNNWTAQTFAYGFLLDRSGTVDYSGNASPNQSGKTGFFNPSPDDIHLLNLNPNAISMDEPIATDVDYTQGGGKFIESRGGLLKPVSIRGTTGFLPPIAPYATHMQGPTFSVTDDLSVIERQGERQSGFYEFYHLRRLFRQFMSERRAGKNIQMHWLDFKGDEFWMIEPHRFRLERSRFGYNYDILFDCLEPSQQRVKARNQGVDTKGVPDWTDKGADALKLLKNPVSTSLDSVTSKAFTRVVQLAASAKGFIQRFNTGVLTLKLQSIIAATNSIQAFFSDVASIRKSILDTPLNLYKQLYSSLLGLEDSFLSVTPDAFKADINEWMIEMRFMTEGLISHYLSTYGTTPGQSVAEANKNYTQPRATQGTKKNFFQETSVNAGSPTVDPFVGSSGLGLTGDIEAMAAVTALRPEDVLTGENIFDVAQRLLGDARRYTELIVFNQLKAPFIVSNPKNKPTGTIAWGERILVPAIPESQSASVADPVGVSMASLSVTITQTLAGSNVVFGNNDSVVNPWRVDMWVGFTIVFTSGSLLGQSRVVVGNDATTLTVNRPYLVAPSVNDTFDLSLSLFALRRAPSPETAAFGRDMLAVFTPGGIDTVIGPRKQTQTVEGLENLEQAINLCLQTTRGSNKSDPEYGTSDVIGRKGEPNNVALYAFYVRQSLMADPRISAVERPRVTSEGSSLFFEVEVRPIRVQRTLFFKVPI